MERNDEKDLYTRVSISKVKKDNNRTIVSIATETDCFWIIQGFWRTYRE